MRRSKTSRDSGFGIRDLEDSGNVAGVPTLNILSRQNILPPLARRSVMERRVLGAVKC